MALFLGIESSCDETAAAVFTDELEILSSVVASQIELHSEFGGVVPEIAARAHLRQLIPVIDKALQEARVTLAQLNAIAVNHTPGLVGAILMGLTAAKMMSLVLEIPLIGTNHVSAHIYACRIAAKRDIFPCLGLVVSGGHTAIFQCHSALQLELLGATRDDAAGEAFDKIAAILGLGFPGGPAVEREAVSGNPKRFAFPRAFLHQDTIEFSFSGLKTSVLYAVHGQGVAKGEPPPPGQLRSDLAASFQAAVIDILVAKCKLALKKTGLKRLAIGGGVIANRALRNAFEVMAEQEHCELFIPPMQLCTDNAAMAALAVEKWKRQEFAGLDLEAYPNFVA